MTKSNTQVFELVFDNIDLETGRGRWLGNVGATDVYVISGSGLVTLLEHTPFGSVTVASVFQEGGQRQRLASVHSRHVAMMGKPVVSQNYGWCRPLN